MKEVCSVKCDILTKTVWGDGPHVGMKSKAFNFEEFQNISQLMIGNFSPLKQTVNISWMPYY